MRLSPTSHIGSCSKENLTSPSTIVIWHNASRAKSLNLDFFSPTCLNLSLLKLNRSVAIARAHILSPRASSCLALCVFPKPFRVLPQRRFRSRFLRGGCRAVDRLLLRVPARRPVRAPLAALRFILLLCRSRVCYHVSASRN